MILPALKSVNKMNTAFIGYECPKCHSTIRVGVGSPVCPSCGTAMVADTKPESAVYAGVTCKKCGAVYGVTTSNVCACGEPFE